MLGLLLLAGIGVAAAALVEVVDSSHHDDEPDTEEAQDDLHDGDEGTDHGDLLDDPAAMDGGLAAAAEQPTGDAVSDEPEAGDAFPEGQSAEGSAAPQEPTDAAAGDTTTEASGSDPAPGDAPADSEASAATDAAPGDVTSAAAPPVTHSFFGGPGNDSIEGTTGRDLLEGQGGNDILRGRGGADHLATYDEGQDTAFGGMGADSLHGYVVNSMPGGDTSFIIEDHAVDHLHGGLGADKLWLGSGDVGTGGAGADEFHVSWDVDPDSPATITDYHPRTDRIVIEFATNRADDDMTPITADDQQLTTHALDDGSGTAICLNGQPIAHVMGTTTLRAADISLVHV